MCFVKDIPENHGISSGSILEFIEETENAGNINITDFMLLSGDISWHNCGCFGEPKFIGRK